VQSSAEVLNNRQSIIDNKALANRLSTIDYSTERLQKQLGDSTLGEKFVSHAISKLGEGQVNSIAEWVCSKKDIRHKGKVFVATCNKAIQRKLV
jgi:hypothetical protein